MQLHFIKLERLKSPAIRLSRLPRVATLKRADHSPLRPQQNEPPTGRDTGLGMRQYPGGGLWSDDFDQFHPAVFGTARLGAVGRHG